MPEESAETLPPTPKPRRKRSPNKPKPPVPPAPEPPNPTILALEADILNLVKQRAEAMIGIATAQRSLNTAQANAQSAREYLLQIEQEVQYRLGLIGQMKGRAQETPPSPSPFQSIMATEYSAMLSSMTPQIPPGVSSIPSAQPAPLSVVESGRRIRSESAEGMREVAAAY